MPATSALDELTAGSDPTECLEWKRQAEVADATRDKDPTVMDIYDVSATPGAYINASQLVSLIRKGAHKRSL